MENIVLIKEFVCLEEADLCDDFLNLDFVMKMAKETGKEDDVVDFSDTKEW